MALKAIRDLTPYEDDWALRVRITRKTSRQIHNKSGRQTETLKLFLLDHEGSLIQATLFNEIIDKFNDILECGKSYVIQNGNVRHVKKFLDNVHDKIEISFTNATIVEEIDEKIPYKRSNPFVNFNDVDNFSKEQRFMDVIGMVVKVRPTYDITSRKEMNKTIKKKEVTLLDHLSNTIKLELWGELASNEGEIIESMVMLRPIIAALNVVVNKYEGEVKLKTTFISFIEMNPEVEQSEIIQQSVGGGMDKMFGPSKRMIEAVEESITNIVASNVDNKYCTFIGKVVKVLSKNTMWYDRCIKCSSPVHPEGNNKTVRCNTCDDDNSSFTRYYLVKMIVTDGKEEVYATLFDAAETIVGCPVHIFAEKILTAQDKHDCVYYKNLMCSQEKSYKFLVKMDSKRTQERAEKRVVIEEVVKVDATPFEEGTTSNKRKLENMA